jgi:hypothetical protein
VHAWVRFAKRMPIACVVRNISERGAFLEGDLPQLPNTFLLSIPAFGIEVDCELKRQVAGGVGVYFTTVVELPVELPRRIAPPVEARGHSPALELETGAGPAE